VERGSNTTSRTARRVSAPRVHVDRDELLAIFAGGALGAVARAALAQSAAVAPHSWPWATFAANLLAALMLGYLVTRLQERVAPHTYLRSLLGTGLCGALSTFSTMMLELVRMVDAGDWGLLAGYTAASLAGGFAMVFAASKLVRRARFAA
jgi:fluoride exporter